MVSDGEAIVTISGIYDLPMIGGEALDVEHACQQLTGGPEITLIYIDGTLVRSTDGVYWKVQDSFEPHEISLPDGTKKKIPRSYYPAGGLPPDSVLVVRTSALLAVAEPEKEGISEKPLSTRERDTLLTIIAVLCKDAGYDYTKAAKTADLIHGMAAFMKITIGETTIENHLKKIPDALGTRIR